MQNAIITQGNLRFQLAHIQKIKKLKQHNAEILWFNNESEGSKINDIQTTKPYIREFRVPNSFKYTKQKKTENEKKERRQRSLKFQTKKQVRVHTLPILNFMEAVLSIFIDIATELKERERERNIFFPSFYTITCSIGNW